MSKHEKKHEEVLTEKLSISFLVNKMIKEEEPVNWTIEHLTNKGPKHKRLQNELLFEQLASLVKGIEKKSGKKLELEAGPDLFRGAGKERVEFPVPLPDSVIKKLNDPKYDVEEFVKGPEHGTLAYSMAIQILVWATRTVKGLE